MNLRSFVKGQSSSCGFLVDRFDVTAPEVDEVLVDVPLIETKDHVVVLQDSPVLRTMILDHLEVELLVERDRLLEIFDVQTGIVLAEVHVFVSVWVEWSELTGRHLCYRAALSKS